MERSIPTAHQFDIDAAFDLVSFLEVELFSDFVFGLISSFQQQCYYSAERKHHQFWSH